jgi:serine/threonine protein kinase/tetratricopeptide (TPR) repeat protein
MANSELDSRQWKRVGDLFRQASELDSSERNAFLERECGKDQALRSEVESLLSADRNASSFLDHPPVLISGSKAETTDQDLEQRQYQTGEILAVRFRIVRLLGKGGMGQVYEAEDLELNTSVALKFLKPQIAGDLNSQRRFHREILLARKVTHPNACRIFDLFRHEDTLFLTMELLKGETLDERIRRSGSLNTSEVLPLVEGMAAALSAAHEVGVIHRDFKSGNVMLVPGSGGLRAVITDFGLATNSAPGEPGQMSMSEAGRLIGTPEFMSPEQLQGEKVTPATDIYALGLVIYHMLTGKLPFSGETPFQIVQQRLHAPAPSPRGHIPELDRKWERTVLKCLEKDPRDRFRSPSEIVAALKGERSTIRMLPKRRNRLRTALAILIAILFITGGIIFSRRHPTEKLSPTVATTFEKRDWVLITQFENHTGEEVLNGTVEFALEGQLSNSQYVNIVSHERIEDALRLMRKTAGTKVTPEIGREIALRDGAIKALVSGEVRKVGSAYAMNVRLEAPAQGIVLKTFHQEVRGQDNILPAVQNISSEIRKALGEQLFRIRGKDQPLPSVTTQSLPALRLFAQADSMIGYSDNAAALELLRQAVREDPDFAMAQIYLAHAICNEGRPREEFLPPAEKAFMLSESVSERERYFIRGSYYFLKADVGKAMINYRALLKLHPDDYWANNNMHNILADRLNRNEEAVPYAVRIADTRPNGFMENYRAAFDLKRWSNRAEEALKYAERARRIIALDNSTASPYLKADVELFLFNYLWIKGDVQSALQELEQLRINLRTRKDLKENAVIESVASSYLMFGKLQQVQNLIRTGTDETSISQMDVILAFFRKERRGMREALKRQTETGRQLNSLDLLFRMRSGLIREAQSQLKRLQLAAVSVPPIQRGTGPDFPWYQLDTRPLLPLAEAELALATGNEEKAIEDLQKILKQEDNIWSITSILASESLARILDQRGETEKALQVLQRADRRKFWYGQGGLAFWMRIRTQIEKLYRKEGRLAEADRIAADLKARLQFADPDFTLSN